MTKINIHNTEGILTNVNLKKATKINICTRSSQECNTTQHPYVNDCEQPQEKNDLPEFIKAIFLAKSKFSFLVFLKLAVDGVSVESEDFSGQYVTF